jgi:hypothetical protein
MARDGEGAAASKATSAIAAQGMADPWKDNQFTEAISFRLRSRSLVGISSGRHSA